ncbi:hypothetical protein RBSH_03568 [Rhodopirellula baltica SH28]|uniref:Uncharacterized protein n=1 Tax=Rhodopirellula baltica SH28 TaxID=993517 RepID=K5CC87_RHOBT|nr:hypothetical protein [Rhodopirellula baltica]EKK01110.1 hypothetical protein RBSH_03568 [Rhodopirellula baltica SH28]
MSFRLKQLNFVVVATCLPAMLLATVGLAQTTSDATNTNSANRTSRLVDTSSGDSHVQSTRNDLIEVIARPIPDDKLSLLLTNVGEADGRLEAQLNELQSSESPREVSLLWLSRVELAVLKSELFAEGSGDGVASAAEAVKIAEAALSALPSGGIARAEVLRLLAEAHLRQGDARSAAAVLRESAGAVVTTSESSSSSESVRALRIRVALSAGDMETANDMLDAVYGSDPTAANVGVAMDLVRLRYLLLQKNERAIADWSEIIRKRHGVNAKDRADTIVAQTRLQSGMDSANPPGDGSDPRLWIADAMYYLRRGQSMQAALHFAKAAVSDEVATRSVDSAMKAAAILSRHSNAKAAIELLHRISQRHPNSTSSADALLQAATIGQAAGPTVASDADVEAMLIQITHQWPESQSAFAATRWRMAWAERQSEWLEAAKISVQFADVHWADESSGDSVRPQAIRSWANAWIHQPSPEVIAAMHQAFQEHNATTLARQTHADLTVLLAETSDALWSELQKATSDGFFQQLASFRQNQTDLIEASPPADVNDALVMRLELDVVQNPIRRVEVARYLLSLPSEREFPTDLQRAGWLIWAGQRDAAETLIATELQQSPSAADEWCRRAATSYAVSQSKSDQKHAARWWKRLADGLPQGDPSWHSAMIGWIQAVAASGDPDKARASAKMVLLTIPPTDRMTRDAYERLSQQ